MIDLTEFIRTGIEVLTWIGIAASVLLVPLFLSVYLLDRRARRKPKPFNHQFDAPEFYQPMGRVRVGIDKDRWAA